MSLWRELPPRHAPLRDLALDLRWTWGHQADALWKRIDADVWSVHGIGGHSWLLFRPVALPIARQVSIFSPMRAAASRTGMRI
jgi:hypothetical protein